LLNFSERATELALVATVSLTTQTDLMFEQEHALRVHSLIDILLFRTRRTWCMEYFKFYKAVQWRCAKRAKANFGAEAPEIIP